jgi:O-antigen/teichoic acid export membrane protein
MMNVMSLAHRELIKKTFRISLYNNAFYLMLNTAATSALGFIFWIIMARFFSNAEVGIGTVLISASGLIASISILGLGFGLIRYMPDAGDDVCRLNNSVFTLTALLAGIFSLAYLIAIPVLAPALQFVRNNSLLLIAFLLLTVVTAVCTQTDSSLIAGRSSRFVFWKGTLSSILKLPLPVLVFASLGGFGIFTGTGVAMLAALLVTWLFFMPQVYPGYCPRPLLSGKLIFRILPFSFTNYLSGLLGTAPIYIFPLMILNALGPKQSAYFYMAYMIYTAMNIIPSGFMQSLFAEGSHEPGKLGSYGRRALVASLLLSLPAVLVMMVLGRWILHYFGAAYAENGFDLFRYLLLSIIPGCLGGFYITFNQIKKRVVLIIAQSGFSTVLLLGLGYWLLKTHGLSGLGLAYLISNGLLALIIALPLWNDLKADRDVPILSR